MKSWALFEGNTRRKIQANDDVCLDIRWRAPCSAGAWGIAAGDDDAALRRARLEARKGRRIAIEAVAYHQRDKRQVRASL